MNYTLLVTETFKSDLKKLDHSVREHLKKVVQKITSSPERFKPLKGHVNVFRLRFSNYRLVYKVEQDKITLLFVRKRSRVYDNM